ncbi:hypothetical protein LWF15_18120 [Kineosporia rhizophila]|uniref:hypothetical protein n=1 Tax=Kineosporia TaxID=49184 RepID=UPI001E5430AB|nr:MULTISPECIES: hypothetical protein [Kineosporia]MCE0537422.1 hypothetical protein [Kineosporia rhizophila]GLY17428.1 hypothetical protein Kisp01_44420 [Kineosporia sp. NBRC 101677]
MSEIKTSLPSIIQFISTPGARRGRVPVQLRAMYEDPTRHPWRYYDPIVTAVVNGLRGDRLRTELDLAVARSEEREESDRRCRGQSVHYAEIRAGMLSIRRRVGPVRVFGAPSGVWQHRDLRVNVAPHLIVERRGGVQEAWFLHLKATRLSQATADGALVIMGEALRSVGCEATPRIVDVRSGTVGFALSRNRDVRMLTAYARSEAEAFARLWEAKAAA